MGKEEGQQSIVVRYDSSPDRIADKLGRSLQAQFMHHAGPVDLNSARAN